MNHFVRPVSELDFDQMLDREWIVANGVGGFASSTVCGVNTRRYHGLLVASMTPPVRRMVLLSRLEETVRCESGEFQLACNEYPGTIYPRGHELLRAFSTEPHPRWAYQGEGWTLQKELRLIRGSNSVVISYTLLAASHGIDLDIRPMLALRGMHSLAYQSNGNLELVSRSKGHWQVPATRNTPEFFFAHEGNLDRHAYWYLNQIYRREAAYGYGGLEDLWSPGAVHLRLMPGQTAHFACSAEPFELAAMVEAAEQQVSQAVEKHDVQRTLVGSGVAASTPESQTLAALVDATALHRAASPGGESFGVAVTYHWSPPSFRAALSGFTGMFLVPGQFDAGLSALHASLRRLHHGLIPAHLPTDGSPPERRSADVSLWFIDAVRKYWMYTGDSVEVTRLLPAVLSIIDAYRHGIAEIDLTVDSDGLLVCRDAELAATWMDTAINGRPVNPRHGRPVEINALWYNALLSAAELCRLGDRPADADSLESSAMRVRHQFNLHFWNEAAGCCFDVVGDGGNDSAVRPNQLLAISLPFAVLRADRWQAVVDRCRQDLLTPAGLRTLAESDLRYVSYYRGPLADRDRAAHNGSAYPWLFGPFVSASVRAAGADANAVRQTLQNDLRPILDYFRDGGLGHLYELADGHAPHHPGGAIASALSVAEILRCYSEDLLGRRPAYSSSRESARASRAALA